MACIEVFLDFTLDNSSPLFHTLKRIHEKYGDGKFIGIASETNYSGRVAAKRWSGKSYFPYKLSADKKKVRFLGKVRVIR